MRLILALCLLIVCALASAAPVTWKRTAADPGWVRWLMPLPKRVSIEGKITVPLNRLRIESAAPATELDENLRRELLSALYEKAGAKLDLAAAPPVEGFALLFQQGALSPSLFEDETPGDQAYRIRPVRDVGAEAGYGFSGLECCAPAAAGRYFAMKTLKQLMLPTVKGQGAQATVDVPLADIVDWPDMDERGQWGGTAAEDLDWLSQLAAATAAALPLPAKKRK